MIPLADVLQPGHIILDPSSKDRAGAIREVAALLHDDVRVLDWDELYSRMQVRAPFIAEQFAEFGICFPHARTDAVSALTMSVGRFDPGLSLPNSPQVIRYIFCIGAPVALATDYLRLVGLLARIAKDPTSEREMRTAATPEEFAETLARLEARL